MPCLFDVVWSMTKGGPAYSSEVLATQMYDLAFGRFEAALIDGCSPNLYFWKLLLPASTSGLAALAIIQSRAIWNDLLFAITLTTSNSARPATVAISGFASSLQVEYGPLMASTVVSILPVMAAYLLFQKSFVRGLLGGAGK